MHHEAKVRFVEAHAQRDRRHENFHFVFQEKLLGFDPLRCFQVRVIATSFDALLLQPVGDPARILNGERINDPATRQLRHEIRQPRQPLGLIVEADVVELERRSDQRPARDVEVGNLRLHVGHHAIVGRGGGAEHRHTRRQPIEHACHPPIVGTEVVTPVGDAMRFVDDEHPDCSHDVRQHVLAEGSLRNLLDHLVRGAVSKAAGYGELP